MAKLSTHLNAAVFFLPNFFNPYVNNLFFENRNPLPVYENYTTVTADEKFTENEKISAKKSMFQNKRSVKWPLLFFKNEISEHSLIDNQDNENFSVKKQARTNIQKKLNQALPIERQLSINPQLFFSCVNDTLILANFTLKCANYFLSSKQTTFQANDEILTSIETKSKQKTP